MKTFYCLLFMLCYVKGVPVHVENTISQNEVTPLASSRVLEGVIREILESVRDVILNGNEEIPVLDPLVVDHLHLDDETIPLPGAHVTINDGTVKNLGQFVIDDVSVNTVVVVTNIAIVGHIPVLEIEAVNYDLFLPVMGYTIFGTGDFNIKLIEPKLDLFVRYSVSSGTTAEVKVSLGAFEPQINGLFNDQAASDFVNLFLKLLVEDLLEVYEDDINTFLSDLLNEVLDNALPGLLP
ncbi:uncharacterized protein LOC131844270 [Achroia grisella]|uniref:uncharacterized protein LOC131844270 n=1 Tax=Achroia grisella TaxID=688607 RepID=UPI0027D20070|nr:uncharacterized protein LOC131844270 [Achroia grisella]